MGLQDSIIDTDTYARLASRFALARDTLGSDAATALAEDIVRRLSRSMPNGFRFEDPVIDDGAIEAFCDALVTPQPDAALAFIRARRAEGLTRQGVYLGYVWAASRKLGEDWETGRLSFSDVTIASGHLYALMRALRAEGPPAGVGHDSRRHAFFATVPGETHGIGVTMAADLFREAGWDIDLQVGKTHDSLLERIEKTRPEVVGLSLSTDERLADLARLVVSLRLTVPRAIVGVAPGEGLEDHAITDLVDIDLLFRDARDACADLDRLVGLHP